MSIYFLRHGQTDWNKAGRWQGRSEIALNETGLAQSRSVAECLSKLNIKDATLVVSPRLRAQQTADLVASKLGISAQVEPCFEELDLGLYEGKLTTELEQTDPTRFANWLRSYHQLAPPEGESLHDGIKRSKARLHYWLNQSGSDDLIIVAHQAINIAMKQILSGQLIDDYQPSTLASYKQSNSQIDVWSGAPHQFLQRIDTDNGC